MRKKRLLILTMSAALLYALSAGAAEPDGDDDNRVFKRVTDIRSGEAIVYVYRRRSGLGAAEPIGFDINGAVTGALWAGRYEAVAVQAGSVKVRLRGVADIRFKCVTRDKGWTVRWLLTKKEALSYLGVFNGPKQEATFQAEAGKEYFVEEANGLRAHLRTEEEAMEDKLMTLKRSKFVNVFFTKDKAVEAAHLIEQDCSQNRLEQALQRLEDAAQATRQAAGLRIVD